MADTQELDYSLLKEEGIARIYELGGKQWTDYGKHDPGITILEELCFGIMDLVYRTNFHIEDLFAKDPDVPEHKNEQQFYTAEQILPCNPLTKWDILKIILNVSGVKNANVFFDSEANEIKGGYKIFVELEERSRSAGKEQYVLDLVAKRLHARRNLCEDFFLITSMKALPITVKATFELYTCLADEENEQIVAQILFGLHSFLSPRIRFHSINQLLAKGRTIDEIFTGPLLTKGFIDEEELIQLKNKSKIYIADLVASATALSGIKNVVSCEILIDQEQFNTNNIAIPILKDRFLELNLAESKIELLYSGLPICIDWAKVLSLFEDMKANDALTKSYVQEEEVFVLEGQDRALQKYISLQQDLPLLYNVGHEGCSPSDTIQNQAKAKQLKSYLMFFDQLFANYLGTLSNIKYAMTVSGKQYNKHNGRIPLQVPRLHSIINPPTKENEPGNHLEFVIQRKYLDLKKGVTSIQDESCTDGLTKTYYYYVNQALESNIQSLNNRSAMLDHLLAYFAEKFTSDSLNLYHTHEEERLQELNLNKALLLKDYIEISKNNNRAPYVAHTNYLDSYQLSGFERRMYHTLGIKHIQKHFFHKIIRTNLYVAKKTSHSKFDIFLGQTNQKQCDGLCTLQGKYTNIQLLALAYGENPDNYDIIKTHHGSYKIFLYVDKNRAHTIELIASEAIDTVEQAEKVVQESAKLFRFVNQQSEGFHLIEHILLRDKEILEDGEEDIYSFRMTLVFPSWPARFQKALFRRSVEQMIFMASPAYIMTNVLWLDIENMEIFEGVYQRWLELKTGNGTTTELHEANRALMELIQSFLANDALI